MRREAKIILATVLFAAALAWSDEALGAMASLETFRVTEVRIDGLFYLTRAEVEEAMGISEETTVWGDVDSWTEALEAHPLVREATVERVPPNGLHVLIWERRPVALVATPLVEPVDEEGVRLPIDPGEYRLDLPLVATTQRPADGARLLPEDVRTVVAEVGRLMTVDTAFLHMVSEVRPGERNSLVARWTEPSVDFLLPYGLPQARLREGLLALAHAVARNPGEIPASIDLRYADQVVVRTTAGN